jgi:transcriptional regulator with XRE-family HTH domain
MRGAYDGRKTIYRTPGQIKTACPLLRSLFEKADEGRISHQEVADALKTSASTVSRWRIGQATPSIWSYHEFAKFLGLNILAE